jgi:hypothetical protein
MRWEDEKLIKDPDLVEFDYREGVWYRLATKSNWEDTRSLQLKRRKQNAGRSWTYHSATRI